MMIDPETIPLPDATKHRVVRVTKNPDVGYTVKAGFAIGSGVRYNTKSVVLYETEDRNEAWAVKYSLQARLNVARKLLGLRTG